jgi:hypothetical protein
MASPKPECFWKRHAASWGLACSRCAVDVECPACDALPRAPDEKTRAALRRQLDLEFADRSPDDRARCAVAWSKHFYVATDVNRLKVRCQHGAPRVVDAHEIAHLFLQRAEQAFDDFVAVWGNEIRLDRPMAIYIATKRAKKDAWRAAYFGGAGAQMVFAGADGKIAGGFCWNGFAMSLDDYDDDRDLHAYARHMIGHILFSCWHGVGGFQQECPRWAFVGAADWLCKSHPFFRDWTTFCQEEGHPPSGPGDRWEERARAIAAKKRAPAETLFGTSSMSRLSYDDHVRSWSYMDTMLREDRARWLALLRLLRERKDHATAFRTALGLTPDEFDARWADRLLGKRTSMADRPADAREPGGLDAADRRRILGEQDPALLAALLRGLEKVRDAKTAELVLSRVTAESDLVRETVAMLLERSDAPEVVEWLRTGGLSHGNALARAYAARVLGTRKVAEARERLQALLSDPHWLARANAARALERLADAASLPALVAQADDRNAKAWIAKVEALASFDRAASAATPVVVGGLRAPEWQVRVVACRALVRMGDASAVEPLIERLETEGGRLQREVWRALAALTGLSFGLDARPWREWWQAQKPRGLPPRPSEEPPPPHDPRYAAPTRKTPETPFDEPTYYGRRIFSKSVAFVLDVSKSMETNIEVPKEAQKTLGTLPSGSRIAVAKAAIVSAIEKLDPRTRFNVIFFSTAVRPWKDGLVLAGADRDAAISAVKAASLEEETNVFGALRAGLGLHGKQTVDASLEPVPDTIYFLTDGTPTRGEITDKETLLSWMRDVNRFAKVDLHVIAMGSLGVDLPFLTRLAAENGGELIHVPDTR